MLIVLEFIKDIQPGFKHIHKFWCSLYCYLVPENEMLPVEQLTETEFSFESEAKGDNLIGMHQTKAKV